MAVMFVELGAVELVEIGEAGTRAPGSLGPLQDVIQLVSFIEDPFAGITLEPGESITPRQRAIAQKLRDVSRMERRALVKESSVAGFSMGDLQVEAERLRGVLGIHSTELGKFKIGKKIGKVAQKVKKVVTSPAFLSIAAVAANFIPIPGVGQIASAGLMGAARSMAAKSGGKMSGMEMLITSAALPVAAGMAFPALKGDSGGLLTNLGLTGSQQAQVFQQAQGMVPGLQAQGQDNFMAMALKGLGQMAGMDALSKGSGIPGGVGELSGGGENLSKLMDLFRDKFPGAAKAGADDVKNTGAATGSGSTVDEAISRGTPSGFPVVPVAIGVGAVTILVTVILVASRR